MAVLDAPSSGEDTLDPLDREALRFLVGPTASGKSFLALELCERAGAELITLDSMQVYRGMDIGTAKPDSTDLDRVPHHLLDLRDPHELYSVSEFLGDARRVVGEIQDRGKRALFVGGTALYLKVLCDGLFEGPPVDPDLRAELQARVEEEGSPALHQELESIDPASAERIHPNDAKRILRALEVHRQTGRTLSDWQREWRRAKEQGGRARRLCGLSPSVEALDGRIRERTGTMLDRGWREEAVAIRDGAGFGPTSIQALGYREVLNWADGECDREECAATIALRTRQFARRQRTWFRSFGDLVRVGGDDGVEGEGAAIDIALRAFEWA